MAHDIVSIGAAVQDVFLQGKIFTPKDEEGQKVEEFVLGSKNDIEGVVFSTGGGATNAAVTFARQGLDAAYMGYVGNDVAGQAVRHDLETEQVDTSLLAYSDKHGTGYSALLLAPSGERTILTYRGASVHYEITPEQLMTFETKWFYISALEGNFDALEALLLHASEKGIKVAWNPGKKELEDPEQVKSLLAHVSVLSLNKEEMQMLFQGESCEDLVRAATKLVGVAVVTDGPSGLAACDGKQVYQAGMYDDVPVVDRTGAGDAFCSGFTAAIVRGDPMQKAITLGSANSTSVVSMVGAKAGILRVDAEIHEMDIKSSDI